MVDSMCIHKPININIGPGMKNPEMPDHLKTKQMCNYAVKKLPFVIRYVPVRYKTKKMCNKSILENGGTPESVPNR